MKSNMTRRLASSLVLLLVTHLLSAQVFDYTIAPDVKTTFDFNYSYYRSLGAQSRSDALPAEVVESFASWDCPGQRHIIDRVTPYLFAKVRISRLQDLKAGILSKAEVILEWDGIQYDLGTIEGYAREWYDQQGRLVDTYQFYKTHNNFQGRNSECGSFDVLPVPSEESGKADVAHFFFFPSTNMVKKCAAKGGAASFKLEIVASAYRSKRDRLYSVSYLLDDCQIVFGKPSAPKLEYCEEMDKMRVSYIDKEVDNSMLDAYSKRMASIHRNQTITLKLNDGTVRKPMFVQDNDDLSFHYTHIYYDLAKQTVPLDGTYQTNEYFNHIGRDDLAITEQRGSTYNRESKGSKTIVHGIDVEWDEEALSVPLPLFSADNAHAEFNSEEREVDVSWEDGQIEWETHWWGKSRKQATDRTTSNAFVYRTEGENVDISNADWQYFAVVKELYKGTVIIEDKDRLFNKNYTYAITILPETVPTREWTKNRNSLPPARTTLTSITTKPTFNIQVKQDLEVRDHIAFTFTPSKIPYIEGKAKISIFRRKKGEDDGAWRKLDEMELTNDGHTAAYYNDRDAESCAVYEYKMATYAYNESVNLDNDLESIPVQLAVIERSHVTQMDATKGERDNSVMVTWDAKQIGTRTTTYEVKRRPANTQEEFQTIQTVKGTANKYSYEDKNADAGQYYEYKVEAYTEGCDDVAEAKRRQAEGQSATELMFSNATEEIGYSQAKAVVSGRISYGSGTSVADVRVNLARQADDQDSKLTSYSQLLKNGGTINWETTASQMRTLASEQQPFTLQMWVHPLTGQTGEPIVTIPGLGSLTVSDKDSLATLSLAGKEFATSISAGRFTHLTLTVNGNNVGLTIDGDTLTTEHLALPDGTWNGLTADNDKVRLTLGGVMPGSSTGGFSGYMREVRLWSRLLSPREVLTTYDRPLSGLETGLALYWPLDEGLRHHSFDVSCTGGVKNKRHPSLGVSVEPSTWVPSDKQLSYYGMTNANGEYTIRGVPFTGTGNTYVIRPEMDGHEFVPATLNAFVNKQALSLNNNDFTDKSSFIYTGVVTYANTDIPVDSVTFEIDGTGLVANGKPVMTDAQGHFTISVPIGSHSIRAVRTNHELSRYPETGTVEFTGPGNLYFADYTLVNVAGRINGGIDDATAPLGFQKSVNRLGVATMTLGLETETNNRFNLNLADDGTWKHRAKPTRIDTYDANINSTSYYSEAVPTDIIIKTDPATGEFSAMLPPLRYQIKSIRFANGSPYNEEDFFKQNLPVIDARNPVVNSIDTVRTDGKKKEYYVQGRLVLNYRRNPVVTVEQNGMPEDAFGEAEVDDPDDDEKTISMVNTVTEAEAQADPNLKEGAFKSYKYFDYPIFVQGRKYRITIGAREYYDYYDEDGQKTKTYIQVPTDGIIHITNNMSAFALVADEVTTYNGKTYQPGDHISGNNVDVSVSTDGLVTYTWMCGSPNFSDDHTLTATISFEAAKKVTKWEGSLPQKDGTLRGIVLGSYTTGKRFITEGPQEPTYVLRDPGGANSSATLLNDTIKTSFNSSSFIRGVTEKVIKTINTGVYTKFKPGTIAANIQANFVSEVNNIWSIKIGESAKYTNTVDEASTIITTTSQKVSTPSDMTHVGRMGDTYIGNSTNIFYGDGVFLKLKKKADGSLALADSTGLTAGTMLGTSYYYNEYHLVNVLIPEWKRVRNLTLEHVDSWSEVPKPSTIKDGRKHYYTIYKEGDARYGKTNPGSGDKLQDYFWTDDANRTVPDDANYIVVVPEEVESLLDTISYYNMNITNWEGIIAQNEDDKVNAIKKGREENISFSGGEVITKSSTTTKSDYDKLGYTSSGTLNVGFKVKNKAEVNKVGGALEVDVKSITTWGKRDYDISETRNTVSYTLSDGNYQAALSISVYDSPMGWGPVFITQGGQTLIPYEGESRCEYSTTNKGTVLDQATMKVEKCDVAVVNANVTDVPNGETAFFTVNLYNNSEVQAPSTYTLYPHPNNNLHGGTMSLDGTTIPSTGISFYLPYGTATKTLALKQGDKSVTDFTYMFRLQSRDDTIHIYSPWKTLTAHFVPTSASVELLSELAVINSLSDSTTLTLRNLDRGFEGLKGLRLQYRIKGSDEWRLADEWVMPEYKGRYPSAKLLPPTGNITKRIKFQADGTYELRAQTFALFGNSDVTRESDVITIVQDCRKPRVLGSGGLSSFLTLFNREDVHITFDEPINTEAISQAANITIRRIENDGQGAQEPVLNEADYTITMSDRELYFSFSEAAMAQMHNGSYEFTVQDIPDLYGNLSDTIRWRMAVDFSSVIWAEDSKEQVMTVGSKTTCTLNIIRLESGHQFNITGAPSWVQLNQSSGSTSDIDAIHPIVLTLLPSAPIGFNQFTLDLTDEKGISNQLVCTVRVLNYVPDWTVDKDRYEDNMIIVGKVDNWIGGSDDASSFIIGAFDTDGVCRGVGYTDYTVKGHLVDEVRKDDPGFVNLIVYGNLGDDELTFRIYYTQTGDTYDKVEYKMADGTVKQTMPFNPSEVVGSYDQPTIFIPGENFIQNIKLQKGWNWVSVFLDDDGKSVEDVFTAYSSSINCIKTKTSFTEIYQDEATGKYAFAGDLASEKLIKWTMYKIHTLMETDITIPSTLKASRWSLTLEPGWNWFGAPSYVVPIDIAFGHATPGDYIKGWDGYASFTEQNKWEGALTALLPSRGYQYHSVSDKELYVLGRSKKRPAEATSASFAASAEAAMLNYADYPENMTLVVQVKQADEVLANQPVNVYVKGTLRAQATTNAQGLCYLTVAGDATEDGAPLSFTVAGAEVPQPRDLFYRNDAMTGTTLNPYILQIVIPEIAVK